MVYLATDWSDDDEEVTVTCRESDLPDSVYHDDYSLVATWESAMTDYKFAHPTSFEPITTAPRTAAQKSLHAPLWYGYPALYPSSHMVTESSSSADVTKRAPSATPPATMKPKSKKQKRVPLIGPASRNRSTSPSWTPASPEAFPRPLILPPHLLPPPPLTNGLAPALSSRIILPPSLSTAAKPVPKPKLKTFPPPPPIVELEPGQSVLKGSTEGDLLQAALWSWYNAGYQTGLYHAAMENIVDAE